MTTLILIALLGINQSNAAGIMSTIDTGLPNQNGPSISSGFAKGYNNNQNNTYIRNSVGDSTVTTDDHGNTWIRSGNITNLPDGGQCITSGNVTNCTH